ncbi:MAG TPA: SRPBCC family protein [Steroidobacteraceae bacterium]|nr:SRPBCC family protein [Steroidobacteraceae bacterium]
MPQPVPDGPISPERLREVRRPIREARGLPNVAYTSEDHFRHERDAVLGRSWAGLAFVDSIPARGYAQPVEFMGAPLLITRDRGGRLRVFHNVCSHRGMKLVAEPAEVPALITCRYHCWSYALSGELKATPHIGGVNLHTCEGFSAAEHGLEEVRSAEFLGMLFINLSGDAPDFAQHIEPLRRRLSGHLGESGWTQLAPGRSGAELTLEVRCNWKLAVENYCESYHLPWVHPALNSYSKLEDHYCFLEDADFSGQGSLAYRYGEVAGTQLPRLAAWPADRAHVAEYPSLYPNVLLGFHADHAFAVILNPLSAQLTREALRIYYVADGACSDLYAACRASTLEAWRSVFGEDVFAVEGMQQGRASPGYRGGVFSPVMDAPTHHFHAWVAAKLAADA